MNKRIIQAVAFFMMIVLLCPPAAQAASGVKTPTASVKAGVYTSSKSVKFSCKTKGAVLYYTTNGSTPTSKSKKYTGKKITVSKTTTFKVIACKGKKTSKVLTAAYTILTKPSLKSASYAAKGITFKWAAVSGAEGYQVFRKDSGGKWKALAKTKNTTYLDKTAKAGKTYSYTVRAYKGKVYSNYNTKGISCKAAYNHNYYTHEYSAWKTVTPATCTEEGRQVRTCPCKTQDFRELPALGHKWKTISVLTEATCTETGLEERSCVTCGKSETVSISALGHKWKETVITAATCTTSGSKEQICLNCGRTETKSLAPLGHKWKETVITAATCETPGQKKVQCTRCSESSIEIIPASGHDFWLGESDINGAWYKYWSKNDYTSIKTLEWPVCQKCKAPKKYTLDDVELTYYEDLSHQLFDEIVAYRQEYFESVFGKGAQRVKMQWSEEDSYCARIQAAYNALCAIMNQDAHNCAIYDVYPDWDPAFHSGIEDGAASTRFREAKYFLQLWKDSYAHNSDILGGFGGGISFVKPENYNPAGDKLHGAVAVYSCKADGRIWYVAIFSEQYENPKWHESQQYHTFSPNGRPSERESVETYATKEQIISCPVSHKVK